MRKLLLPAALGIGLLIAYVDSRPNWDDTGITALALFACCAVFGALEPKRCWLWALATGRHASRRRLRRKSHLRHQLPRQRTEVAERMFRVSGASAI